MLLRDEPTTAPYKAVQGVSRLEVARQEQHGSTATCANQVDLSLNSPLHERNDAELLVSDFAGIDPGFFCLNDS